jgi:peptidylprolyl isomerase
MRTDNVQELIVQFGKDTKKSPPRSIPLELFYRSDTEPTYSITSDDDQRATEAFALPFQAFGALGMARGIENPDSAEAEVFILKWRQALMPPGRNTLDGFYSCFGYIVSNNENFWSQITANDVIRSIKVISGSENLINKT